MADLDRVAASPRFALIFTLLISSAWADPNVQEKAFLEVPGSDFHYSDHNPKSFETKNFPKGFIEILAGYDWGIQDSQPPAQLFGFCLDLNQDGKSEYFIATIYGGSGGPDYMILSEFRGHWKVIGGFQGAFMLSQLNQDGLI